jgi:hypothetical protein
MVDSSVREALLRYSRKEASTNEVMRSLMLHEGFLAPVLYAARISGGNVFQPVVILGSGMSLPAHELWLFTDDEATQAPLALGLELGPYAAGLLGRILFAALPSTVVEVRINHGSDPSQAWVIGPGSFPMVRLWAAAIELEQALATTSDTPDARLLSLLKGFEGYLLPLQQSHAVATAASVAGLVCPAVACTTPDSYARFVASLGDEGRGLRQLGVAGADLFASLAKHGVDGILFNPQGPGPTRAFPLALCSAVLAAA